jgi:hypothetical protein
VPSQWITRYIRGRHACVLGASLNGASPDSRRSHTFVADHSHLPSLSGILERGILDLIIKVAALVMTYVVGTDVFVAGKLGRLGLVAESVKECLSDALLETDAGKGCNDFLANILSSAFRNFCAARDYVAVQKMSSAAMNSRARSIDKTARPRGPPAIHRSFQSDQ